MPKRLRQDIQIVAVERRNDGVIELIPKVAVDESQAWFWTDRWQQMERQVEAEKRAGKIRRFDNVEELIKDLDA